jgi:nucleoid DNA-binding protein
VIKKKDLLSKLSNKSGKKQEVVEEVLKAFAEVIHEQVLLNGKTIRISGIGSFKQKLSKARTGRNPKTGEALDIKESKTVALTTATAKKSEE